MYPKLYATRTKYSLRISKKKTRKTVRAFIWYLSLCGFAFVIAWEILPVVVAKLIEWAVVLGE